MIETFMEAYHHMGAHAKTFEPNFPANLTYIEDPKPAYMVGHARHRPGKEETAFDNGIPFFPKLDKQHEKQAFAFITVYPFNMILALPDAVIFHRVQPISADKTLFQAFCLVPPETMEMEDIDDVKKEYKEFMDMFNMEDITQNIAMQAGVEAGSARIGRLHSRLEAAVWQLNTFVTSKLTEKKLSP
jgi:phenylpropionate dioxygenase-like ring-hydroxylating dioxygenase large terminal subunit